jgi:hypothetical protein
MSGASAAASSANINTNGTAASSASSLPLYSQFPISSHWELTLTNDETVKGEVYCTDPVAGVVVLQDAQQEVRLVSIAAIRESKQVKEADADAASVSAAFNTSHAKKALDEREKRSLKLAQESLKSVNPKVRMKFCVRTSARYRVGGCFSVVVYGLLMY